MRVLLFFITVAIAFLGCSSESENKNHNDSLANTLKDISDYKTSLIQAKVEKATELLGQPDDMGTSPNGVNGYLIYYDKVTENRIVKHLVIFHHYNDYKDSFRAITKVEAVIDGETIQNIVVKKPKDYAKSSSSLATVPVNNSSPTKNKFYFSLLGGRGMNPFLFLYFIDDNFCIKDGEKVNYWYDKERHIIKFSSIDKELLTMRVAHDEYYEVSPGHEISTNFDYTIKKDFNINLNLQNSDFAFFEARVYINSDGEERLESTSHNNQAYVYAEKSEALNTFLKETLNGAVKNNERSIAMLDEMIAASDDVISQIQELDELAVSQIAAAEAEYDYKTHIASLKEIKRSRDIIFNYLQKAKTVADVYDSKILFDFNKRTSELKPLIQRVSDEYNLLKYKIFPYLQANT